MRFRGLPVAVEAHEEGMRIDVATGGELHVALAAGGSGVVPLMAMIRTRARLVMEAANANVAGMQQQLYYPPGDGYDPATWEPGRIPGQIAGVRGTRIDGVKTGGNSIY